MPSLPLPQTGAATPPQDPTVAKMQEALKKFDIPSLVKQNHPDLIPLIIETESMNDDERRYWFSMLPVMTDEQVSKLKDILMNEKVQLQKLDEDYAKELTQLNDKSVTQWKEMEMKEKWDKMRTAEKASQQAEESTEEDILKQLQQL